MLFQYTLIMLLIALVTTILSFHRAIDEVGKVYCLLVSAVFWFAVGPSLLSIDFVWGGSQAVVSYSYIASTESGIVWIFYAMGLIQGVIGIVRAVALTYQPVVDNLKYYTGDDGESPMQEIYYE